MYIHTHGLFIQQTCKKLQDTASRQLKCACGSTHDDHSGSGNQHTYKYNTSKNTTQPGKIYRDKHGCCNPRIDSAVVGLFTISIDVYKFVY